MLINTLTLQVNSNKMFSRERSNNQDWAVSRAQDDIPWAPGILWFRMRSFAGFRHEVLV